MAVAVSSRRKSSSEDCSTKGSSYVEDTMQRTNLYYDSNPFGTSTYIAVLPAFTPR